MVVPLLDAVLGVEVRREEARRMNHVRKPILLRDALLYRHQNTRKKRFGFGFRDRRDTWMTGRDQQDCIDEGGVRPFGIIGVEERDVKVDGVNDESPLVLKRKPDVESSE
jgi:hypothetical protein